MGIHVSFICGSASERSEPNVQSCFSASSVYRVMFDNTRAENDVCAPEN